MSAHTPGPRGSLPYYDNPPGIQATYAAQPCGCRIEGNGTLPHPLTIERCPAHAAALTLLEAAKVVLAGLVERVRLAPSGAVPVFDGIADLADAINEAEGEP